MAFMTKQYGTLSYQPPVTAKTDQKQYSMTLPAHRQFTSPAKLYSAGTLNETLNKKAQVLPNGAVGIDFRFLAAPNLAKSEVLKMLAAEEQTGPGLKRVAWPPPPDCTDSAFLAEVPENQQAPIYNGTSHKPWENSLSNSYYQPSDNQPQFHQEPQRPARTAPTPPRPFANSPPPSTVTLRPEPPISQVPAPVFQSQPAVKRQEPIKMRGDQKWPPAHYKEAKQAEMQAAQEAAARARAAGKPKRVKKDYSSFFAQNALLPTYPGYKAPPGTQHYEELGTSNL